MRRGALVCVLIAMLVPGCTSSSGGRSEEILVFAAASLKETFDDIGSAFERAHRGIRVSFNYGASSGLATSIANGARADVFASASPVWMDAVAETPGVAGRAVFSRNRLVVIVPKDNPAGIRRFADLAKPGIKVVLAATSVPAGRYARAALMQAGLRSAEGNVVSNEVDVKGVVQKVLLGESDAGIVYATDVTNPVAAQVSVVSIPDLVNIIATYPIAVVQGSSHAEAARAFVAFVLADGQAILRAAGFLAP